MNSRERVLAALRHEEPDRVPYDLSATPVTGIHYVAYSRLRDALGLPYREPVIWHMMQQLAWVDEDVHLAMETDVRGRRPEAHSGWQLEVTEDDEFTYYTDEWGIARRKPLRDGLYYDLHRSPLTHAECPEHIDHYPFPAPADDARFPDSLRAAAEAARADGRAFVLGGICPGMLEMGQWMRGYENFFCDLGANLPLAEALCDRITELKLAYWEKALALVGDLVDVVQEGDDYGAQNALQVSPALWRQLFKPRLARLIGQIKKRARHVSVFFHSCGSVRSILPELAEVGVDILNPVQVAAAGMDTRELKREFGDVLTFWGGGIDTQRVLPTGTPQEVRDEVKRRVDDLAPGGGFVFNPVHNVQSDVPPENLLAMREALRDYGAYGG